MIGKGDVGLSAARHATADVTGAILLNQLGPNRAEARQVAPDKQGTTVPESHAASPGIWPDGLTPLGRYPGTDARVNAGWQVYSDALRANMRDYFGVYEYPDVNHGCRNDTTPRPDEER